ncbi:UbiD family decarboxylase [Streptomyces sp. VRA16 Mangrove soil]|uniref:UbiD family decarboxylase n=1 Tax=Streptomyces sp. VRA16 Mangrove soil TaxID=2817434 RepID=UPI001A9FC67D|nr:UbiD family decarboxylase [Streptomyces sp. VRA16 Mangrove soil]MBO1331548.1 UbiD family decarboxylase [Streptomyces sp. VRA16 Mangrove soil]
MTATDPGVRAYVEQYRAAHPEDVLTVDDALEGPEVAALVAELADRGRTELLVCPHVKDLHGTTLVTNVFASRRRVARLLGTDPAGLHAAYERATARRTEPALVADGPVLETVAQGAAIDLTTLPLLRHFDSDRGPYLTSGVITAEAPEGVPGRAGNLSYHRALVHSRTELATSLHSRGHLWQLLRMAEERGEVLPVAMVVGAHPLFQLAASARVGPDIDERTLAGGLLGRPLDVVRTPRHGIRVPAHAELVLEGVIDPARHAPEGPFGEFSGYSSDRSTNDVLTVHSVLRRRDAVLLDVVGGNSADHLNLARIPRESETAARLKARFPEVTALHYPTSGTHFHAYVALRRTRPGQARQILLALLGWDPYLKTAVAVDEDVDVTRDEDVLWAMATHLQPHADVFMVDGLPGSPLDPSSTPDGTTSRMGLDATRGPHFDAVRIRTDPARHARARALLDRSGPCG